MKEMQGRPNLVNFQDYLSFPRQNGLGYDVFLRMELLTSLKDWTRKRGRALQMEDILDLGVHMSTALILMEQRHYIHRDIKPANVFIDEKTRQFKLGDFGTARVLSSEGNAATVTGTPNYMAPEVYLNRPPYDQTVDIFSLGVMLYRYLNSGLFPYATPESPNPDTALSVRTEGKTPLAKPMNADDELGAIVLKCLAYNPRERYQTAQELLRALGAYRANWRRQHTMQGVVPPQPTGNYTMGTASMSASSGSPVRSMNSAHPVQQNIPRPAAQPGVVTAPGMQTAGQTGHPYPAQQPMNQAAPVPQVNPAVGVKQTAAEDPNFGFDAPSESLPPRKSSSRGVALVIIAIIVALAIAGVAGFLILKSKHDSTNKISLSAPAVTAYLQAEATEVMDG